MTITLLPVDADPATGDPEYTAQRFRQAKAAQHGAGSGRQLGARSGFRVGTPGSVFTATSTTWTLGPCAAMIDPGAATYQGTYEWSSDANESGTVVAADDTNPRRDLVYIQVNDFSSGDGSGELSADVLYLVGTPAATPSAPPLPPRSFIVGWINVPKAGGGSPTAALNTARFVAAGGILPVDSDATAAALAQSPGLTIVYPDGMTATSDGTQFIERNESVMLSAPDAGWTVAGGLIKTRSHGGLIQVNITARITRNAAPAGGPFTIGAGMGSLLAAFIPVGWRPKIWPADIRAVVNDTNAVNGMGEPVIRIGTDGTVAARVQWGGATISATTGWTIQVQGSWFL